MAHPRLALECWAWRPFTPLRVRGLASYQSHKLLFDESPIAISPWAARTFGLAEAVFLQQLHYRLHMKSKDPETYARDFINDRYWVYWTMRDLHVEIPLGRSDDPYKRVIGKLRKLGILLVEKHRQASWNQTNFYSIDYGALDSLVQPSQEPTGPAGGGATDPSGEVTGPDEGGIAETSGGEATDHCSKNSTETSVKTTTTTNGTTTESPSSLESGRELQWTVIPSSIRSQLLRLIPAEQDQQRCLDLVAARILLDRKLPKEQQLSSPVRWFTTVIVNPDFTAADQYAEERRREQTRTAASIVEFKVTLDSKVEHGIAAQKREEAALATLASLSESTLLEVFALAASVCECPNFAAQIADAVSRRVLPPNRHAKT